MKWYSISWRGVSVWYYWTSVYVYLNIHHLIWCIMSSNFLHETSKIQAKHTLASVVNRISLMYVFEWLWGWSRGCCHDNCSQWPTGHYIDTISYQGVMLSTVIVELSHVVALTHSTIQYSVTALKAASFSGHHKVVELLLSAGANPDLQDKVRTGQDSGVHGTWVMEGCIPCILWNQEPLT